MSLTNTAEDFKYATQGLQDPTEMENDDIIAFSLPARSNIGQTSDCPETTNPVDQIILDQNNLVRADTAVTGKRNDKNRL